KQRTIINSLEDYEKHYFLGGSPEFSNFDGLLNNIKGLQMHTEEQFWEPKVNVWGISDKDLFLEANDVFRKRKSPFFAYIQTSGNHRPYNRTIPESDTDFVKTVVPEEELKKYGFESLDEFNCFRYSDYCFRKFMEAAVKEEYFHNTIFVFVGDHGLSGTAEAIYPSVWTEHRLTDEHVPLLFYAPDLLAPDWRTEVVSQVDVLPTIAGLLHQSYINTTLGRDLLDPEKKNNYAFITNTAGGIGMVTDDFYFTRNINFPDEQLVPMHKNALQKYSVSQLDSVKKELSIFTTAYFESAKYLLMNNKDD
ncbi:MAG TPA: LTA synthase family protein, partial [Chitinophagaceae bacterium]|nr:LTA synthase family protein [Chitinophagaceae bacterium]